MPAVVDKAGLFVISESFRTLVEEFEPNRHQFRPYALRNGKRGAPADEPYFIMNITNRADSVVYTEERKKMIYMPPSEFRPEGTIHRTNIHYNQDDVYSLRRADFEGFHLWWEASILNGFFVSEAFMKAMDKAKLKKLERVHCLEV